jgi:hypothetical protein
VALAPTPAPSTLREHPARLASETATTATRSHIERDLRGAAERRLESMIAWVYALLRTDLPFRLDAYRLFPSNSLVGSSFSATPSRQRALIAIIGLPPGAIPRAKELTPHTEQKR